MRTALAPLASMPTAAHHDTALLTVLSVVLVLKDRRFFLRRDDREGPHGAGR